MNHCFRKAIDVSEFPMGMNFNEDTSLKSESNIEVEKLFPFQWGEYICLMG